MSKENSMGPEIGLERLRYEREKRLYLGSMAPDLLAALIDMTKIAKAASMGVTSNQARIAKAQTLIDTAKGL